MLELNKIFKSYTTGDFRQEALDGVSLRFRKKEFVAILGPSGSGKTTCLNVIGGLDRYDKGDLTINGKTTKRFRDADWDAYRNNSVGFVFQNYYLIPHLSVLENVEMGMTLSGVSKVKRRRRAAQALARVGLADHKHKRPSQLSGGQAQRVAIARALVNNPDIILADEPTGALDSVSSRQIMELIREIAGDKLVIMVTHNAAIADAYADRIIKFEDGRVASDSNPPDDADMAPSDYALKRTRMKYRTALNLSGRNILTKKWRTALTAFASSIGIIGIALILSLSNGFDIQIRRFESDTMSGFPIIISQSSFDVDAETMQAQMSEREAGREQRVRYPDTQAVLPYNPSTNRFRHENVFSDAYIAYIEAADPSLLSGISYTRLVNMNLLTRDQADKLIMVSTAASGFSAYPKSLTDSETGYLEKNYDLLAGAFPKDYADLVLVVDTYNRLSTATLKALGMDSDVKQIAFEDIIGREYKLIPNDTFYRRVGQMFLPNIFGGYSAMYNSENAVTLRVAGILRAKEEYQLNVLSYGLVYSDALAEYVIQSAKDSAIVNAQLAADVNVMTGQPFTADSGTGAGGSMGGIAAMGDTFGGGMRHMSSMLTGDVQLTRDMILKVLGGDGMPFMITIYPTDFASKDDLTAYLNAWNEDKPREETVLYTDLAETVTNLSGNIMRAITIVLVSFAGISLVVSLIMIGIITWISVLERTKEIGILRALGARKGDITRVFTAETFIIGTCSGLLGIGIAYLLTLPVNSLLHRMTDIASIARLNPRHAIVLLVLSVLLTLLGGAIPARKAAKKEPVDALRTE
ncbi:MAG: ABC transporter ATP-binding protein/permease [Firmicutes bacterium]|nr:ABC transporter ATP-binding protein/permease [Bacillota bacterium]